MNFDQMIEALRNAGYAVALFKPGTLPEEIDLNYIEQEMVNHIKRDILYLELDEPDEPDGMSDVEADADTLKSIGWGTDEDYGGWNET